MARTRPENLPDFEMPPLDEVVLGVQFVPPPRYRQIYAGAVWDLYRSEFPLVEEQIAIAPAFETFGVTRGPSFNFEVINGPAQNRFWFLAEDGHELIQFQQDRLLHNWRRLDKEASVYPRFETMVTKFERELNQLQTFFEGLGQRALEINQCEVTYINHIAMEGPSGLTPDEAIKLINFGGKKAEAFDLRFAERIDSDGGSPIARMHYRASIGQKTNTGEPVCYLELTVRGAPEANDIQSAIEFLEMARRKIVTQFAEVTSERAHEVWRRKV